MMGAVQDYLAHLRSHGTPVARVAEMPTFAQFTDVVGLPEFTELDRRFRQG
jgi:hypothetical protein